MEREPDLRVVPKNGAELRADGYVDAAAGVVGALRRACPGAIELLVPGRPLGGSEVPELLAETRGRWVPAWVADLWWLLASSQLSGGPAELWPGGLFGRTCAASGGGRELGEAVLSAWLLGGRVAVDRLLRAQEADADACNGRGPGAPDPITVKEIQ